jgi:hypothetical protein
MDNIKFQNQNFKLRELDLPEFGNVLISTFSLNDKLMNENGSYVSEEALNIDERIFYFVEENEISLPYLKLTKRIINQLK